MNIKNDDMAKALVEEDWNTFYSYVIQIIDYMINHNFSNLKYYTDDIPNIKSGCLERIFSLVDRGQIDPEGNIVSYLMGSIKWRVLDYLKTLKRRKDKVDMIEFDEKLYYTPFDD